MLIRCGLQNDHVEIATMLPTVEFCGMNVARLIIGANPFGGYSHQNPERNVEMKSYYSVERILETWHRAEDAGYNTFITNNETPHVLEAVEAYLSQGGSMQWIAQIGRPFPDADMLEQIDLTAERGAVAGYIHGAIVDKLYAEGDAATLRTWIARLKSHGLPAGVAGHCHLAHLWVDELDLVDFHTVCFFNCGSVHHGKGDKFLLEDLFPAVDTIQKIRKPCIGYKIMAAGRIDPRMAFEFAFKQIKPGDVVNVGMHRGDKDDMVEENAAMVRDILAS
jgi:hypothetical protein